MPDKKIQLKNQGKKIIKRLKRELKISFILGVGFNPKNKKFSVHCVLRENGKKSKAVLILKRSQLYTILNKFRRLNKC